jgi:hypothetical protein
MQQVSVWEGTEDWKGLGSDISTPDTVVKWLTFMLHVWEIMGSEFSPKTDHPDWGFLWFSTGECQNLMNELGHDHFLMHLICYSLILPFKDTEVLTASLNKSQVYKEAEFQ